MAMNSNANRVTFRSLPSLTISDDQYKASLDVAEPNQRDIKDYIETKISGDAVFKEFIKAGLLVGRSCVRINLGIKGKGR